MMPSRPPSEPGLGKPDLGFWLWLVGFIRALVDWFKDVGPEASQPMEHRPVEPADELPAPAHPKRKPKYPVDTRPGHFNSDTGTWN